MPRRIRTFRFPKCEVGQTTTPRQDTWTHYDRNRRRDPALALVARFRGSRRWQNLRLLHRRENPVCCDPFNVHALLPKPTTQSHHVIPLIRCIRLGLDKRNLRPLCDACHNSITRLEQRDPTAAVRIFFTEEQERELLLEAGVSLTFEQESKK